jgi:hypothetical protein
MHAFMTRIRRIGLGRTSLILLCLACAPAEVSPSRSTDSPADLEAMARSHYEGYTQAIATPRRDAIAGFYAVNGATRVINGVASHRSRAALDSSYRGPWSPPAYFAWDTLAFDSIGPGQVLVTGLFHWQSAGQSDTMPWIYAALLHAADSGLAIVFEHETIRPKR